LQTARPWRATASALGERGASSFLASCPPLHEAARSGREQVVDAAIMDGATSLTTVLRATMCAPELDPRRSSPSHFISPVALRLRRRPDATWARDLEESLRGEIVDNHYDASLGYETNMT
jgi:hypothetical protein